MKLHKRIFSVFLAVVIFTTAMITMPKIQETEAYSTANTNDAWNDSYHSLVDGKGDSTTPGYTSPYAYELSHGDNINEYNYPDQFAVTSFNDCENKTDINGEELFSEPNTGMTLSIGTDCNDKETGGGGTNGLKVGFSSDFAKDPKNNKTKIKNYNGIKLSDYSYIRFRFWRVNVEFDTSSTYYMWVKAFNHTGDTAGDNGLLFQQEFTTTFKDKKSATCTIDVRNQTGTLYALEIHILRVRRTTEDTTTDCAIWYDNFRLIKNTTHTEYFSYTPTPVISYFNDCTNVNTVKKITNGNNPSNYTRQYTPETDATYTKGCLALWPDGSAAYTEPQWYNIGFQNSTGINPSNFTFFRVFIYLGDNIKNVSEIGIYFSDNVEYNVDGSTFLPNKFKAITLSNFKPTSDGWYAVTIRCDDINMNVKCIAVRLGFVTINQSTDTTKKDQEAIHIDALSFIRYTYTANQTYSYLPGHYKVLEGFEEAPDDYGDLSLLSSAVRKYNVDTEPGTKKGHGWYETLPTITDSNGNTVYTTPSSGITFNGNTQQGMYAPQWEHTVTQGQKACWWRPVTWDKTTNSYNTTNSYIQYSLKEAGKTVDITKFTHFSFDMAIRNLQLSSGTFAGPPGLKSNSNPIFHINFIDGNGTSIGLEFRLRKDTPNATEFLTSSHDVQGFPLKGFIPGFRRLDTASGCMRIMFTLSALIKQNTTQSKNFDFTNVASFRLTYLGANGTNDSRTTDLFLDNLVGFTPDMTINVINEGVNTDTDPEQRFVYTIVGTDAATNHVNIKFSMEPNTTEEIKHLPLNGYTITQQPWSWRYLEETKTKKLWDNISITALNTTHLTPAGTALLTYKAICDDRSVLTRTVTFTQTRYHDKWLTAEDYDVL